MGKHARRTLVVAPNRLMGDHIASAHDIDPRGPGVLMVTYPEQVRGLRLSPEDVVVTYWPPDRSDRWRFLQIAQSISAAGCPVASWTVHVDAPWSAYTRVVRRAVLSDDTVWTPIKGVTRWDMS